MHPDDLGADPFWATDGPDFVLGSTTGVLRRALGLLSVLHDPAFDPQVRNAATDTIRAAITYLAAESNGQDAPAEVVALRESILLGHLKGDTLAKNPASPPWIDALASFSTWANQPENAPKAVQPLVQAALRGARHGLPEELLNQSWVTEEREWVLQIIGDALGFEGNDWQSNRSDLNGGQ